MSKQTARKQESSGSFPQAWTVARVRGVPIRVDVSWLLIAGLVVWLFFTRFATLLAEHGSGVVIGAAAAATFLFFASLLAHELGHALTSLDRDIPVVAVTLFLLGGVTESASEAKRARDEIVIVGIGPYISLVLAGGFGLLHAAVQGQPVPAAVTGYLAWVNLMLAVFNVLPGYPLDGGRLLRAVLWAVSGRPHASTRWAARVGQLFAGALMVLGAVTLLRSAADGGFGGLWEILIGFFLYRGASEAHKRARLHERLAGRTVGEAMGSAPPALPAGMRLDEAVERLVERPSLLWPVGDPVAGAVTLAQIDEVPSDRWALTTLGDVALPAEATVIDATAPLDTAVDRLADAPGGMLLVVSGGRPVGLLTPSLVAGLQ